MSRYFTEDHEWIQVDGDTATVGITEYAQSQLGDIVFVETPEEGKTVSRGDDAAVVESVKAASDVYAPVGGEVVEGNPAVADDPAPGARFVITLPTRPEIPWPASPWKIASPSSTTASSWC